MPVLWAARYNTWLLIQLTPRGVILFFFLPDYACQAVKQGGCSPWAWGVTVLGGQLAHLTTGRTWLFCFVWGGGRPQLMGGGV